MFPSGFHTPGPHRYLVLLVCLLAVLLNGMTEAWSKGVVFALMGVCMLLFPVRGTLGRGLSLSLGGLLLLGLTSFLPKGITGLLAKKATWRTVLEEDLGVPLGGFHSAQPWVSLENWLSLLIIIAWFAYLLRRRWPDGERRFLIRGLALGTTGIALLSLVLEYIQYPVQIWGWEDDAGGNFARQFGPFANLNHMGTLLAVGGVLCAACAYDDNRRRRSTWPLYVVSLLVLFFAALVTGSKGGVLLLFCGLGAWILSVALSSKSPARIAIAASLVILLVAGLFRFGGPVLEQFKGGAQMGGAQGRLDIYRDTGAMIAANPFFGVGLGNFEGVFNVSRNAFGGPHRALHPESSLLWMTSEMGVLSVIACGAIVLLLVRRIGLFSKGPAQRRHQRRLRAAAGLGAAVVIAHCLFDIPGHVPGTSLLGLTLAALAVRPLAQETNARTTLSFRAIGALTILGGLILLGTRYFRVRFPGAICTENLYVSSTVASSLGDIVQARELTDKALAGNPLRWELWNQRGQLTYLLDEGPRAALSDFRVARYLNQSSPWLPAAEAKFWLTVNPSYAPSAWRELMERDPTRRHEHYNGVLAAGKDHPELMPRIRSLSRINPRLQVMYMSKVPAAEFPAELRELLSSDPELKGIEGPDRQQLFALWAQKGDREEFLEKVGQNPSWEKEAWPTVAREKAKRRQFSSALDLVDRYYDPPALPVYTGQAEGRLELQREFMVNLTDVSRGVALFQMQMRMGDGAGAILTAEKIKRLPDTRDYAHFLHALALAKIQDFEAAWNEVELHLRANRL